MADAISETAELFRQEISGGRQPAPRSNGGDRQLSRPSERMFSNLGESLNPGEKAGGDPDDNVDYQVDKDGNLLTDESGNPISVRSKPVNSKNRPDPDEKEDEDDDDNPDDDDDQDEDDAVDEDEDDDPALKRKYEVMVDGQPAEVSVGEALKGYIRQETFHRRVGALEEERVVVKNQGAELVSKHAELAKKYDELAADYEAILPPEPNWDELYTKNPTTARQLQKNYEGLRGKVAELRGKRDKAVEEATKEATERFNALGESEFKVFAGKAGWRKEKQAKEDMAAMNVTAKAIGFSDEEINNTIDSRMLLVLLKASRYDRMVGTRPRPVNEERRSARRDEGRPGSDRQPSTPVQRRSNGQYRSNENLNSIDAAAAVFQNIISAKPRGRRR